MPANPMSFQFDNSFSRLPDRFYARLAPTPVSDPALVKINHPLARRLGIDPVALATVAGIEILAGNEVPDGADPLAMAYAGHQFGGWVPQLGDGRAILLGEVIDSDGVRRDIQLKGSGQTPFSRMGDGRAWIGPVLREYIVSEAMASLGIPTTRALAAVVTGDTIFREEAQPGAVLTRVASSHIRVGTFQFFASRQDIEGLQLLADHVIERHFPEIQEAENPYVALLDQVVRRQATLIAKWMSVGFIHGVMNTDNMSICGETIDYGPCAFMDTYHPDAVFSSIDHHGRYAYHNQSEIAQWNLSCLASAILPLLAEDEATAIDMATVAVNAFPVHFNAAWTTEFRAKLGLFEEHDDDFDLANDLLSVMAAQSADFTLTFRHLCGLSQETSTSQNKTFDGAPAFENWVEKWRARLERETQSEPERQSAMRKTNPAYIPRNHRVEAVIQAACKGDFKPFETLHSILSTPFHDQQENIVYQQPPLPEEVVHETFCGT